MQEKGWAKIGKVSAVIVGTLTAITLILTIVDRFSGARIEAVGTIQESYVRPDLRPSINYLATPEGISNLIYFRRKDNKKCAEILQEVEERVAFKGKEQPLFEEIAAVTQYARSFDFHYAEITIENNGSALARNVVIILPHGSGYAEIAEDDYLIRPTIAFKWTNSIPLEDLRPSTGVKIRIWSETIKFTKDFGELHAVVQHDKGTTYIRKAQLFYGWDADVVAWLVVHPSILWGGVLFLIMLVWVFAKFAIRRGYVVLRPRKSTYTATAI